MVYFSSTDLIAKIEKNKNKEPDSPKEENPDNSDEEGWSPQSFWNLKYQ